MREGVVLRRRMWGRVVVVKWNQNFGDPGIRGKR